MGNHDAGQAMGRAAELALKMRTNQTALALLDEICEPYRGADAEFEAPDPKHPHQVNPEYIFYTNPNGPLGRLIAEAFSPGIDWIVLSREAQATNDEDTIEAFDERWDERPYKQFNDRYEFC